MARPKIALWTSLPATTVAYKVLRQLDFASQVELSSLASGLELGSGSAEMLRGCGGVICRPTDPVRLLPEHLALVSRPFWIATLSTGDDAFRECKKIAGVQILRSKSGNAGGTAEMALLHAVALTRRVPLAQANLRHGEFRRRGVDGATRLMGKTWMTFGSGAQVRCLLPRLLPLGVSRFVVWNDRMTRAKFDQVLEDIPRDHVGTIIEQDGDLVAELRWTCGSGREEKATIMGTLSDSRLGLADIVSLHVDAVPRDEVSGRGATEGLINTRFLDRLKPSTVLINVSRGELLAGIDAEREIIERLRDQRLGGYGTDVLFRDIEASGDVFQSPLWLHFYRESLGWSRSHLDKLARDEDRRRFGLEPSDLSGALASFKVHTGLNLSLTPHIGGVTDTDFNGVAIEVVKELLVKLGVSLERVSLG